MKKLVIGSFLVLLIVLLGLLLGRSLAVNYLHKPLATEQSGILLLTVERGDTARTIVQQVNQHFKRGSQLLDYRLSQLLIGIDRLQTGLYEVAPQDSWKTLWQKLAEGDEKQFQVTLIEGLRFQQWLQTLSKQPYIETTLSIDNVSELLPFSSNYPSPEGLFLPETYTYRAGTTDVEILTQAYNAMQDKLAGIWAERSNASPVETPYELLIFASIIEKETGIDGERALVASVFSNRLKKGMRLQSDPTTIYGIENFDGNLTRAHLREKTAYNTYRIDGLPPTPIAMVSTASLQAAAQPAESNYYYFVADNIGGHIFSTTLEAHNRAVYEYQVKPYRNNKE